MSRLLYFGPRVVSIAVGLALMAAPGTLGYEGFTGGVHHTLGPVIATCSCIALWEVAYGLQRLNFAFGPALILASLPGIAPADAAIAGIAAGVACILLAIRLRPAPRIPGGGWRSALALDR